MPEVEPEPEDEFLCGEPGCDKTSSTYSGLATHIRKVHERPPTTAEKKKVLV